jgi:hypothetical protein
MAAAAVRLRANPDSREPIAPVGDPPACTTDRNCRPQRPAQRQDEISGGAENGEVSQKIFRSTAPSLARPRDIRLLYSLWRRIGRTPRSESLRFRWDRAARCLRGEA